ncbi:hypothetical protein [Streptomyces sp. NBC_00503]|uniref:hypothetical protein n=1 Tax=Streptomyces sp. NBC_00503 TaxID=2903659 RepID=UPI002E8144FC|nr:hypothetical protein [Streptomyces sp. NBC_00503]WUD79285.1 hypothetical protein OG490_01120 [Streptomyces sp. NBC_00503]
MARLEVDFPTKKACSATNGSGLYPSSVRGSTVVDPSCNLVYLLAKKCVVDATGQWKPVATTIVINPRRQDFNDDRRPGGNDFLSPGRGLQPRGRVGLRLPHRWNELRLERGAHRPNHRDEGHGAGNGLPNVKCHRELLTQDRLAEQLQQDLRRATKGATAPGGLGVADGTTLLTQAPLGTPSQFVALAVNNATAKVYAVDPANNKVEVFRTGSA